jgi:hypothetical protein
VDCFVSARDAGDLDRMDSKRKANGNLTSAEDVDDRAVKRRKLPVSHSVLYILMLLVMSYEVTGFPTHVTAYRLCLETFQLQLLGNVYWHRVIGLQTYKL